VTALIHTAYKKFPALSYDTALAANAINLYDGNKITRFLNFEYTPVARSVKQTSEYFLCMKNK